MSQFTGKVAVVTGSTSGIGYGIARDLAKHGATLVINGFGDAGEIETLRSKLESEFSVKVVYSGADMSRPADVRGLIEMAERDLGSVDILINCAGIQHVANVDEFPDEKWDAIIAINLSSNFHAIKAALPGMKKRNWGRIVNIASVHGLVASPYKSAYVAAKHGVIGLTKTIALELAQTQITCNAICPGFVRTPLVEKQIDQQAKVHQLPREKVITDVILASQPTQRFVEVEELAALTTFVCSPAASGMTGSALTMDGGWTAR